jgi:starch synthase
MTSPLSVLFLASEADPFVKIGGLGDVGGSLPRALHKLGVDIRLAIPLHGSIRRSDYDLRQLTSFDVPHSGGPLTAEVFTTEVEGLPVFLISGPPFKPGDPVYSNDWGFDAHKFIFFSLAALELARKLDWPPAILHANDWHTAAAVYWLALNRPIDPFFARTASLLTIHNLPYLGMDGSAPLTAFGLPPARHAPLPGWAQHLPLPLGLLTADHITAVSPTYAREILTPEFGSGLHEFLQTRADTITGILNGLDQEQWNPAQDSALASTYDQNSLSLKAKNKAALQQEFGLPTDPSILLLAFIGRLNQQKGVDLILDALPRLATLSWQAVFLGTGIPELEEGVRKLQKKHPERVQAAIRFDTTLSRRIYAGADALLVPSAYEPCGLVQMIAMRYGSVPVVRATGGLKDTVFEEAGELSNGFLFTENDPQALANAIRRAILAYNNPPHWQALQRQGMQQNFSWQRSASEYRALYQKLMKARHS